MDVTSLFQKAIGFHQVGKLEEAAGLYTQIVNADPVNLPGLQFLALARLDQGREQEAFTLIGRVLALRPQLPEALAIQGNILMKLERFEDALASFEEAVRLKPEYAEAFYNCGNCQQALGRFEEAAESYSRALAIKADYEPALVNRGNAMSELGRHAEALDDYDHALHLNPSDAVTQYNRGRVLKALKHYEEALQVYDISLATAPNQSHAWNDRGIVLRELGRLEEALASFDKALSIDPDHAPALFNRGTLIWSEHGLLEPALKDLERAAHLDPDQDYVLGNLLHLKMYAGNWHDLERLKRLVERGVNQGKKTIEPFAYQAIAASPLDLERVASIYATHRYPEGPALSNTRRLPRQKIRVGYLSGEFRTQATAYLAVGLYECHDRENFEILAFDNGKSDGSPMRKRLEAAFDRFVDISDLTDHEAAQAILDEDVDILVNLNGYFGANRMGVFALRPAPIQVNYLGFPGTLGASYVDYILADATVIVPGEERFYAEKVVRLPGSYQVNDAKRVLPSLPGRRGDHGLPEKGFVFCNFNQSYKLTPEMFALWMAILKEVEGSVLWLLQGPGEFPARLKEEAGRHGVTGDRLVFAQMVSLEEHLNRLQLTDLFLDSLPYNAHTTASDALWAGVPLLTCRGPTFPGRVAASLLAAVGLSELIAEDVNAYQRLAVRLARDPSLLAPLKERLRRGRLTSPLFDTDRFRRGIETAYRRMREIAERGEPPQSFDVSAQ